MKAIYKNYLLIALVSIGFAGSVLAQTAGDKKPLPTGTLVRVNGHSITEATVQRALTDLQNQGVSVTPQVREQVISELVLRQLMVAEATRRGLEKTPDFSRQLEDLRARLLVELLVEDNLAKSPITEQDERAEYARQKQVLGGGDTTPQYFLSQLVYHNESQARDAIAQLRAGTQLDKLAVDSEDAATKANGGKVGWVFPTDVLPAVGNVVVNLGKGTVAAAPIQTPNGWHVIRVDDIRPFKLPGFDESREQLRQSLKVQRRQALLEGLIKGADIQR